MRSIDISSFTKIVAPSSLCPAPDLRWLAIADLVVDPRYQREINIGGRIHIRRIAEAFDWRQFSAVMVSPVPGGKYAIIDGQHRTHAAALCGIETVPCQIIQADEQEQAKAFEAVNSRKIAVKADARYKAALAAGVPDALRIRDLTNKAGIRLLTYIPSRAAMRAGETTAHGTINELLRVFNDDQQALFVLTAIEYAAGDAIGVIKSPVVGGFVDAFQDCPDCIGDSECLNRMVKLDLADLFTRASKRAHDMPGTTARTIIAAHIVDVLKDKSGVDLAA